MIDTMKKIREALEAGLATAKHCRLPTTYHQRVINEALALLDGMIEGGGWETEPKHEIPILAHMGGKCVPSQCLICYGAQMERDKHDLLGAISKSAPPAQTEISSGEDK